MLLGAYGFAIATIAGWPLYAAVLVAMAAAAVFALILGIPTLKLRGDYLAIVTIAAAEIVRLVGRSTALTEITGASSGLRGNEYKHTFTGASPFPDTVWSLGPFSYATNASNSWWIRIVAWVVVGLACLLVYLLIKSPWGRVLKGIREDEDAVRSLGKNVYSYKMQSLILGGVFGALAGFVIALRCAAINPSFFATDVTFFAYTVLLIGGAARVFGPVVGSIIFWFLISFLDAFFDQATSTNLIPNWIMTSNQASLMRFIFMGLALMLLMIFRPQGIFGDRRELAIDAR
jgi:branched-chain amino acid transport system permease protein